MGPDDPSDCSFTDVLKGAKKPGAAIFVYFTGQGALDYRVADGAAASSTPISQAVAPASAAIGGQPAGVLFTGMTPGFASLAQMKIVVPSLAPGTYPLILTVGGVQTNAGNVDVSR